jgi:hypothetical protein
VAAARKTAVLVVTTDHPHPSNWMGAPAVAVLPSEVAAAVRRALGGGWNPTAPGPAFHLDSAAAAPGVEVPAPS